MSKRYALVEKSHLKSTQGLQFALGAHLQQIPGPLIRPKMPRMAGLNNMVLRKAAKPLANKTNRKIKSFKFRSPGGCLNPMGRFYLAFWRK